MDQQVAGGGHPGVLTAAASEERKKFRRSVERLDTALLVLVFFLVRYALSTAALGTAFPREGRPIGVGEVGVRPGRGGRGIGHGLWTALGGTR